VRQLSREERREELMTDAAQTVVLTELERSSTTGQSAVRGGER
jgi:hypothetical protein